MTPAHETMMDELIKKVSTSPRPADSTEVPAVHGSNRWLHGPKDPSNPKSRSGETRINISASPQTKDLGGPVRDRGDPLAHARLLSSQIETQENTCLSENKLYRSRKSFSSSLGEGSSKNFDGKIKIAILKSGKFFVFSYFLILVFAVFSIYLDDPTLRNIAGKGTIVWSCFAISTGIVFMRVRYKTLKNHPFWQAKAILGVYFTFMCGQIMIAPLFLNPIRFAELKVLTTSILVGVCSWVWVYLCGNTSLKYWSEKKRLVGTGLFFCFLSVPLSLSLATAALGSFWEDERTVLPFLLSSVCFSVCTCAWNIETTLATHETQQLTENQVKIRWIRWITVHSLIVAPLSIFVSTVVVLFSTEPLPGSNHLEIMQWSILGMTWGLVIFVGLGFIESLAFRSMLRRNQRWAYFSIFTVSFILPTPFVLPMPILDSFQESILTARISLVMITFILCVAWSLLIAHSMFYFELKHNKSIAFLLNNIAATGHAVDDSQQADRQAAVPRRMKTVVSKLGAPLKGHLRRVWFPASFVYITAVVTTLPLLVTLSLSQAFAESFADAASVKSGLWFASVAGIGNLLWQWLYWNNERIWGFRTNSRRLLDSLCVHFNLVFPVSIVAFGRQTGYNLVRYAMIVLPVIGVLYFAGTIAFYNGKFMWRFTRKERIVFIVLYVILLSPTTSMVVLHWAEEWGNSNDMFPESATDAIHFIAVLSVLLIACFYCGLQNWFKRRSKWVKIVCAATAVLFISFPISLIFPFRSNETVLLLLACFVSGGSHTAGFLIIIDSYWTKNRRTLEYCFIATYSVCIIGPLCVLPAISSDLNAVRKVLSAVLFGVLVCIWIYANLLGFMFNIVPVRRFFLSLIFMCFAATPFSIWVYALGDFTYTAACMMLAILLAVWERCDYHFLSPWALPNKMRFCIAFVWVVGICLPLICQFVLLGTNERLLYEKDVVLSMPLSYFLFYINVVGSSIISYILLHYRCLAQYKLPRHSLAVVFALLFEVLVLVVDVELQFRSGNYKKLERMLIAILPLYFFASVVIAHWKIVFVDKFIMTAIFGVLLPLMSSLRWRGVYTDGESLRVFNYFSVAIPISTMVGIFLPIVTREAGANFLSVVGVYTIGYMLPFGTFLPIYLHSHSVPLLVLIIFLVLAVTCFAGYKTWHRLTGKATMANKEIFAIKVMDWFMHWCMLFSLIILLLAGSFVATEKRKSSLTVLFVVAPALYVLKSSENGWKWISKKWVLVSGWIIIVLGIIIAYTLHLSGQREAFVAVATALVAFPALFASFGFLRVVKECIRSHPNHRKLQMAGSLLCCIGVLIPFGVALPVTLSTNWDFDIVYGKGLLLVVSLLILICLCDVSTVTIAINSTFHAIQKEKRAKFVTRIIKMHLLHEEVHVDDESARFMYDVALSHVRDWKTFEKLLQDEKVLVRFQNAHQMTLSTAADLKDNLASHSVLLCGQCITRGWKVSARHQRKTLCKTCVLEELIEEQKRLEKIKKADDAAKAFMKIKRDEEVELKRQLVVERKNQYKSTFALISEKDWGPALEIMNKILEQDNNNPAYLCHRAMIYVQMRDGEMALRDANRCVALRPKYEKGIATKASAEGMVGLWSDAVRTYRTGLVLFPRSKKLQEGKTNALEALKRESPPRTFFQYWESKILTVSNFCNNTQKHVQDDVSAGFSNLSYNLGVRQTLKKSQTESSLVRGKLENRHKRQKLYGGKCFRIQMVDVEGIERSDTVTSIRCEITIQSKSLGRLEEAFSNQTTQNYERETNALTDLNKLYWPHEYFYFQHWYVRGNIVLIKVVGTQPGNGKIKLGTIKLRYFDVSRYCRERKYKHFALDGSSTVSLGLAFDLLQPNEAVHGTHQERKSKFLKKYFFNWRKRAVPILIVMNRIMKEVFASYACFTVEKKNRKNTVFRQMTHKSELIRLKKMLEDQKSGKTTLQKNESGNVKIGLVRKSTLAIRELKMTRTQFEKFTADARLDEFHPNTIYLSIAVASKKNTKSKSLDVNFDQFKAIILELCVRMNPSMSKVRAQNFLIESHIHKFLPLYDKWRKTHVLRISNGNMANGDPRETVISTALKNNAATKIRKWWKQREKRLKASKLMHRWYIRRKIRREKYPEVQLRKQMVALLTEDEEIVPTSETKEIAKETPSTSLKLAALVFNCLFDSSRVKPSGGAVEGDWKPINLKERKAIAHVGAEKTNNKLDMESQARAEIQKINACRKEWPEISNSVLNVLKAEVLRHENDARINSEPNEVKVDWKVTDNVRTFHVGLLVTLYQYLSIASNHFPVENVNIGPSILIPLFRLPTLRLPIKNSFHISFWVSVCIAFIYPFYSIKALRALKKGTFGLDESGQEIKKCCSRDGIYNFVLNAVNDYLYFGIMFMLVSVFSCKVDDTESWDYIKYTLSADDESSEPLECFNLSHPTHIFYMVAAAMALVGFYPLATLLAPNFQFNNKALDIKFDQSFLIMEHQAELLMIGFSIFYQDEWAAVLVPQFIICTLLAISNHVIQPCLVSHLNIFRTSVYLLSANVCLSAMVYQVQRGQCETTAICAKNNGNMTGYEDSIVGHDSSVRCDCGEVTFVLSLIVLATGTCLIVAVTCILYLRRRKSSQAVHAIALEEIA